MPDKLEELEEKAIKAVKDLCDYIKEHDEITDQQMETVERVEQEIADMVSDILAERGYVVGDERTD